MSEIHYIASSPQKSNTRFEPKPPKRTAPHFAIHPNSPIAATLFEIGYQLRGHIYISPAAAADRRGGAR